MTGTVGTAAAAAAGLGARFGRRSGGRTLDRARQTYRPG